MAMEASEEQLEEIMSKATTSGASVVQPAQGMDMEQLKAMQSAGPSAEDITQGMSRGYEAMTDMRTDADVPKLLEIAESCKADANSQLATSPGKALKSYLVGIWLLQRGDPQPTRALVAPVAVERDAKLALGAGSEEMTDAESFGDSCEQVASLRAVLHNNAAAAALKINMFTVATMACDFVLATQPEHPKALFRRAKAEEGAGNLSRAISTLGKLLKVEGQSNNTEARKLLQSLRTTKTKEAKGYGGFFEKLREDGGSLSENRAAEEEQNKAFDLKNRPGEQDFGAVADIINNKMQRLPQNMQDELSRMNKYGVAPSEVTKAYRRFLLEAVKQMAAEASTERPQDQAMLEKAKQSQDDAKIEMAIDAVQAMMNRKKPIPKILTEEDQEKELMSEVKSLWGKQRKEENTLAAKKVTDKESADRAAAEMAAQSKAAADMMTQGAAAGAAAAAAVAAGGAADTNGGSERCAAESVPAETAENISAEKIDVADAAKSGDGSVENVGIKLGASFPCSECRQQFDTERARQLHWKFIHDPNRHQED